MTKFVHIVQVHPVVYGIVQTHKVILEKEFTQKEFADFWIAEYNDNAGGNVVAVYLGCVNDETGELV